MNVAPSTKRLSFYLGVCYAFLFLGYYVVQGYSTVLFPSTVNVGWALQYACYSSMSLVAPMIPSHYLPLRPTLSICFVVYVAFVASMNLGIDAVYLVACVAVGIAAGVVWFIQGRYMMHLDAVESGETGAVNAIFWALFYSQNIIGALIALGVLFGGMQLSSLIWIMCGVSSIGVVLSFFIRTVQQIDQSPKVYFSAKTRIRLLWLTLKEKSVILLIPLMALQGVGIVLSYQIMPRSVALASPLASSIDTNVAFCSLAYGIGNIFGAFGGGRLYDRSWRYVFIPICVIEFTSGTLMILFNELALRPTILWTLVGFLRGVSDTAMAALICSVITTLRFHNVQNLPTGLIFGLYRGVYCFSFIPVSLISGYVSYIVIVSFAFAFTAASIVSYGVVFKHTSADAAEDNEASTALVDLPIDQFDDL